MTYPQRSDWLSRHPAVVDGALFAIAAGLLGPASFGTVADATTTAAWKIACYVALTALHLVPLVRRTWPVPAYGVASAAMAVLAVAPNLPYQGFPAPAIMLPSVLLYFFALYEVCASDSRRLADGAAIVALLGAVFVIVRLSTNDSWTSGIASVTASWPVLAAISIGGVAAAWGLGRLRHTRLQYQLGVQRQAALDERARIARDMHDVVSHSLTVMVSQAEGGRMSTTNDRAREIYAAIADTGRSALGDMRGMLGVLRDDSTGRSPAPTWEQIRALTEQATSAGLPTSYAEAGAPAALSPVASLAAYRITQEALTNAMKHAGRQAHASVRIDWEDGIVLTIATTGERSDRPREGGGSRSMQQRAAAAGGQLDNGPTPDGWLVTVKLPAESLR